ncbi:MAG: cytochrome c [Bradyrhizobium sp.]|uniref:c-type cytochrome n=1 Tax=Bradyrhizobium sp. TaxID=376 RepID=UPI0025BA180E|nr:c-type cytochrome [Bradyrhizobium sp.]MBI5262574.1 cytochrome c [Bradyrhizobium sp.]
MARLAAGWPPGDTADRKRNPSGARMNASDVCRGLFVSALFVASYAIGGETSAQPVSGDPSAGRRTAATLCMQCHQVSGRTGAESPSGFAEIANLSSTTPLSLKVFLRSNHNRMPNLIISESDTDDLIAFILSLKK